MELRNGEKTSVDGAVKLKKSDLDNNENIREMHIQVAFPQLHLKNEPWNSKQDDSIYWHDHKSIHFTILSNLGSTFDCEFIISYWYNPRDEPGPVVGRFLYKLIIDGFEIQNILYDLKISDDKGGISNDKVGHTPQKISHDQGNSKYAVKDYEPFSSGDPAIPNRIMGFIKVEFIPKEQKSNEFEDDYDDYEYDGLTIAERYDFWTRGLEKIKKIEEIQGISIEEHEENQVSIREMFNQMLKFSEEDRLELFEFDDVARGQVVAQVSS